MHASQDENSVILFGFSAEYRRTASIIFCGRIWQATGTFKYTLQNL